MPMAIATPLRHRRQAALLAGLAALLLPATSALAQDPEKPARPPTLAHAVAAADAIVRGTVATVAYRLSDDDERIPHTFVTYRIEDTLRGRADGDLVTLRFVGGTDGRGRFLSVVGVPMFSPGDQDILMIQGNGTSDCPLVDCEDGRLRIFRDQVYDAHGRAVVGYEEGRLRHGDQVEAELLKVRFPAPAFDELMRNPEVARQVRAMGREADIDELRRRYAQEAPRSIEHETGAPARERQRNSLVGEEGIQVRMVEPEPRERTAVALDQVRRWLVEEIRRAPEGAAGTRVVSVDPDTPFKASTLAASRPPRVRPEVLQRARQRGDESAEERREREAVERQEFNPVIRRDDRQPGA